MAPRRKIPSESVPAAVVPPPPSLPAPPSLTALLSSLEPLLVAPDEGLFLFSSALTYLYVNAAGAAMTGHVPGELVGGGFVERSPGIADTGIAASMRRAMESGEAQYLGPLRYDDGNVVGDFEHLHVPVPDGVLVLARKLRADASAPGATMTLARAEELARRQAELSAIFDVLPVGLTILDTQGRVIRSNPALGRILRLAEEEIDSGRYRERRFIRRDGTVQPPEEFASTRAIAEGRVVSDVETGVVTEDGSVVWTSASAAPVDAPGVSAVVVTHDTTGRRRAEEALRVAAARDALLVEESVDAIFRFSLSRGRFLDVNPAACVLFGYTREELFGMDLVDLAILDPPWAELFPQPGVVARETATQDRLIRRKDGSQAIVSIRTRQLPDGSVLANARDLTRERALEAQVEQAQRMEAVGRLAGGIAHDFNNQLMAINGYAALVADSLPPGDPRLPDIDAIRDAGERAAALTRQLLAFSRRQTLQPAAVDVAGVVVGLRPMLTRLLGEEVTLFVRAESGVGPAWADRSQLEQVVVNLVTNARDAMPAKGALAIETAEVEIAVGDPRLKAPAVPGRYVRLAVTDTGTGIDAGTLEHVFEPFFTTKERGRGTGLGLSTVEGVVTQSGGFVTVESELGRGTTFDVFLPRTEATAADRPILSPGVTGVVPQGPDTILIVEDEPAVRAVTGRILRELGYDVIEAAGPTQALIIAAGHPGSIDLLLTDVVMPEMNGRELAEQLVERRPGLAILFMSGYSPESVFRDGYLDEGAAYLQKPFTREDLAVIVRAQLHPPYRARTASVPTHT